ncbi:hypothetical protein [Candidatus Poriferisodalis sp.]|uniref:hypothetical protein n=1 Tax=Candidatus Poriferisodalis sp. TaxID=3101277 RepID=UPI003B02B4F5
MEGNQPKSSPASAAVGNSFLWRIVGAREWRDSISITVVKYARGVGPLPEVMKGIQIK